MEIPNRSSVYVWHDDEISPILDLIVLHQKNRLFFLRSLAAFIGPPALLAPCCPASLPINARHLP
ncbi:hypothetical protein M408DRAFT_327341 [Serendipita vermifera MAFF 305830]|uniref:Uncharacterized protein n=1 Tax=Serendipita vermifera MAFF 305830 TaxID=933852 RepID=A0A0C3BIK4_SERVB|nr:hypothetical protein M408DRAFT_327341 [Serendipita vermifera MAFF 305830]